MTVAVPALETALPCVWPCAWLPKGGTSCRPPVLDVAAPSSTLSASSQPHPAPRRRAPSPGGLTAGLPSAWKPPRPPRPGPWDRSLRGVSPDSGGHNWHRVPGWSSLHTHRPPPSGIPGSRHGGWPSAPGPPLGAPSPALLSSPSPETALVFSCGFTFTPWILTQVCGSGWGWTPQGLPSPSPLTAWSLPLPRPPHPSPSAEPGHWSPNFFHPERQRAER